MDTWIDQDKGEYQTGPILFQNLHLYGSKAEGRT